jgi:hypothetical protein
MPTALSARLKRRSSSKREEDRATESVVMLSISTASGACTAHVGLRRSEDLGRCRQPGLQLALCAICERQLSFAPDACSGRVAALADYAGVPTANAVCDNLRSNEESHHHRCAALRLPRWNPTGICTGADSVPARRRRRCRRCSGSSCHALWGWSPVTRRLMSRS